MLTDLALRNLKPRATLSKLLTAMACTWPFCRRAPFPSGTTIYPLQAPEVEDPAVDIQVISARSLKKIGE